MTYIKKNNEKDARFNDGDHVRISKNINIIEKGYAPHVSAEIFMIKQVKNVDPWTYVIEDFVREEIVGTFYKKNYKLKSSRALSSKSNQERR